MYKDVYFWFDEEITFYNDIIKMCFEQNSFGEVKFAITSVNQKYNSSDLLFPYDKFSHEQLKDKEYFSKCCRNNLKITIDCLRKLIEIPTLSNLEIFVVEGYDINFKRKRCTLNQMKEDLLFQIELERYIDSCIYEIHN